MMRLIIRCAAFIALLFTANAALAEIVVTDVKGREVRLAEPAKHVLLGFYYEDFIAVAGPGAIDKIAAVSLSPWRDWRPKQFEAYLKVFPQLANIPDVGDTETGDFSIEKAIAAKPDLVILAAWSYDALGESVKQFDAAGIGISFFEVDDFEGRVDQHVDFGMLLTEML